jgi:hypothetical protein
VFGTGTKQPVEKGSVMGKKRETPIEAMYGHLAEIERRTAKRLGKKANLFLYIANDWIDIHHAILDAYPKGKCESFMLVTFWGLFKEIYWFHFFFSVGNYPLLLSRLRFVWESVFRAYFAETYKPRSAKDLEPPGPSADDKVEWLEMHEKYLRWGNCIKLVLCQVFPLAGKEKEVLEHYEGLWQRLHRYVHPSAYLANRLVGPAALHATDNFDKEWAIEAIDIATHVFDLVWMAVLAFYPEAFAKLAQGGLRTPYPILGQIIESARKELAPATV